MDSLPIQTTKEDRKSLNGAISMVAAIKWVFLALNILLILVPALLMALSPDASQTYELIEQLFSPESGSGILVDVVCTILCVVIPICMYFFLSGKKLSDTLPTTRPEGFQILTAVGTVYAVGYISSSIGIVLLDLIYRSIGLPNVIENIMSAEEGVPTGLGWILLMGFAVAVMPAFLEETALRGIVLSVTQKFGVAFTIILNGFLFSFLHNSAVQVPFAFAIGCLLAYYTLRYRSIWVAIISHFVFNFSSVLFQILYSRFPDSTLPEVLWVFLFFLPAIGFAVAGAILYGFRRPDVPDSPYSAKQKWKALFSCPAFYVFLVGTVLMLVLEAVLYNY